MDKTQQANEKQMNTEEKTGRSKKERELEGIKSANPISEENNRCQFMTCMERARSLPINVIIYSPQIRYLEILTCESHKNYVEKQWDDVNEASSAVWGLMGKNPLSRWDLTTMKWYHDTLLKAAIVMMKNINIMMRDIQYSYQDQLLPDVFYLDNVALEANIESCKLVLTDRVFQRQEELIRREVN